MTRAILAGMKDTNNKHLNRRLLFAAAVSALLAGACGSSDPRLGEDERVRFVGGGCTGSTTLAVGARIAMDLQSATNEGLPGDLGVTSESPSVITARMGIEPNTVELKAISQGESRIALTSEGDEIDALTFSAAPAGLVKFSGEPRAFVGGAVDINVGDVFGDCGEKDECRLIGDTFLHWRVEPEENAAFILDFDGMATFRAKAEGSALLLGREASRSADLVTHPVEFLPASRAKSLTATLSTLSLDPSVKSELIALPGSVTRTDAVVLSATAVLDDSSSVPLSRRDVEWHVEGAELLLKAEMSDAGDRFGTIFLTTGTGKVTVTVDAPITGLKQSFDIDLQ